jgi:hypothetical protein
MPTMRSEFTGAELEAYLDESLPIERMTEIEAALRDDVQLRERLSATNGRRDAGVHSIGEIWRRHRLSCPSREQLGSHLLGVLPADVADYVKFHLESIECRYCRANLEDLRAQQSAAAADKTHERRRRYFQSSVGHLHRDD